MSKHFIALWAGIGLLVISWLIPPWTAMSESPQVAVHQMAAGFRCVFLPQEVWSDNRTFHIDVPLVLIIDLGIAAITAGAMVSLFSKAGRN